MRRPKRFIPVSIGMSPHLAKHIRVLAAKKNKSRSQFVREVLEHFLSESSTVQTDTKHVTQSSILPTTKGNAQADALELHDEKWREANQQ